MRRLIKILRDPKVIIIYMTIIFAVVIYYIYSQREVILHILSTTNPAFLFYAFAFGCLNLFSFGYVTFALYRELGAQVSLIQTMRIIFLSRLGVYVPGKIWYATNYYLFSRKLNVPSVVIGQSFIVINIFLFLTGGALSLPIVFPLLPDSLKVVTLLAVLSLFVLFHPWVLRRLISIVPYLSKPFRDLEYLNKISGKFYFKMILCFIILWLIAGTKLYFCALSIVPIDFDNFLSVLASASASRLTGLLAIFAPAGIGVNEGVGTFALSQVIPLQHALLVMIVSRLLQVVTELGLGLYAFYRLSVVRVETRSYQQTDPKVADQST